MQSRYFSWEYNWLFKNKNMSLTIAKCYVKHITIPSASSSYSLENLYMGQLPDLIGLAFVQDKHMSGSYKTNPFNFQNCGITFLALKLNSSYLPALPYQPDFGTNKKYINEYYKNLSQLGFNTGPQSIDKTPEDWVNGDTWFWFKVTPGIISPYQPRQLPKSGSIRLDVNFAAALDTNVNVICYSQHNGHLEIDRFRNVIV